MTRMTPASFGPLATAPSRVTHQRSTFRSQYAVGIDIAAPAAHIWQLLTDSVGMPRWNSTVTRIQGPIVAGQRLAIEVSAAPGRTFRPRVVAFDTARRMVWADGMAPMFRGVRTFALTESAPGQTRFQMDEVLTGLMLPMIRSSLPDFAPIFVRYAEDLKREAEGGPGGGH